MKVWPSESPISGSPVTVVANRGTLCGRCPASRGRSDEPPALSPLSMPQVVTWPSAVSQWTSRLARASLTGGAMSTMGGASRCPVFGARRRTRVPVHTTARSIRKPSTLGVFSTRILHRTRPLEVLSDLEVVTNSTVVSSPGHTRKQARPLVASAGRPTGSSIHHSSSSSRLRFDGRATCTSALWAFATLPCRADTKTGVMRRRPDGR
mmetsp:Transcript_63099/g.145185  ORF Transcript_63099/g.145185 Transcript_63099/m.145185 type:complete len:208 (-) Transcript_63099:288-911(-)